MLEPRKQFTVKVATRSGNTSNIKYWAKDASLVLALLNRYSDIERVCEINEV